MSEGFVTVTRYARNPCGGVPLFLLTLAPVVLIRLPHGADQLVTQM